MKTFMDKNFLLQSGTAEYLYHEHAAAMPVIDYHCHLSPAVMAENRPFRTITEAWLAGDHYKWRAMRANGIDEHYCTGKATDAEKFRKWAETVPFTLRNPLYHWTHLELRRYFGITELLSPATALDIYERTTSMLQADAFRPQALLQRMNVEVVCTTDDPADSLEHHKKIRESGCRVKVFPAWRPDRVLAAADPEGLNAYLDTLAAASGTEIRRYGQLISALRNRHDFFHRQGCRLSDHGLERLEAEQATAGEVSRIFSRLRSGKAVSPSDAAKYRSALLLELAEMDAEKSWTQQFHLGAMRNNNTRMFRSHGGDTGHDSIGDYPQAAALSRFLDRLDSRGKLTRTILYNLNPADNEVFATMIGNFQDGAQAGKIQWGSGWWFLDQKDGMERQLNALSNLGLLSRFIGMLTDSRSFLSFPRHEYFRRILCNMIGSDVEAGLLPGDRELLGTMVRNICYDNARAYFQFPEEINQTTI
jgi:glucuronate isomerase